MAARWPRKCPKALVRPVMTLIKLENQPDEDICIFDTPLAATTKAWRYKRYKHNRKLPFHRLSAARGVSNMQIPSSGWFPNLIKVKTGLTLSLIHI